MSDPLSKITDRETRLEQLLADYLHAVERGQPPDRQAMVVAHPEYADDLHSFFRNQDSIGRLAGPLKAAADAPTLLSLSERVAAGSRPALRYFGDYELLDEIARGGMGVVYKARQVNLNRIVALKMILAGQLANDSDVKRFYAEAEAAARLDHPGIVPIFEIGQHDGQHYFSMAFVEGESLASKVARGPLPPREAAQLLNQVAAAVEYAHAKGIVHRDLKPANVLLDVDGQPKVTDFGLAKQTQGDSGLTGAGQILGTPSYMPPEQAAGRLEQVGPQSDVYSLGAVLYCLLTGRPPFQAASPTDTLLQVLDQEPAAPRQLNPQVPLDLETIALKCLEKEPSRRYARAADLGEELGRFLCGEPILARPIGPIERAWRWCQRNPAVAGLTAAVTVVLLAGTIVSSSFAFVADKRAKEAADNAQTARQEKAVAEEQRQNAQRQEKQAVENSKAAEQARDDMQAARKAADEHRTAAEAARGEAETALYFNKIGLSYQYWLADNVSGSRRILDECPAERRGWEWRYLDRLQQGSLLTLPGNGQFTTGLKFSADGKRMAAFAEFGQDAGVRVWDMATNEPLSEITQSNHGPGFSCFDLSADGKTVVLGDRSGAISFWDTQTGKPTREFTKLPRPASSLSYSPDGKWLAAAFADGRNGERLLAFTEAPRNEGLIVWEVASGNEVFHPQGYGFRAWFSPDGSRLLSFRINTSFRIFPSTPETFLALLDTNDWKEVPTGNVGGVHCCAFSGDGRRLAVGGLDRQRDARFIRLIDPSTGKELSSLVPSRNAGDVALNGDGTLMAVCERMGASTIEVRDMKRSKVVSQLRGHRDFINGVVFSPDGRLASCSWDNTIRIWDATAGRQVSRVASVAGSGDSVRLSPNGELLAYGERNTVNILTGPVRTVTLVDTATGKVRRTLPGHEAGANVLAFSSDGARLVSGGRRGDVKVWDTASGKSTCSMHGGDGQIVAVAITPDGRIAVSAHEPPEVTRARFGEGPLRLIPISIRAWDADTGAERPSFTGHPSGVYSLALSPDGKRLVSTGGGTTKVWDVEKGTELPAPDPAMLKSVGSDVLLFSPKGDLLVTAAARAATLWNFTSGRTVATLQGHRHDVEAAVISPDQSRIATAVVDEVKLWDVATGHDILTLPLSDIASEAKPRVAALAWTPDGQQLRAGLNDGTILTWDARAKPEH